MSFPVAHREMLAQTRSAGFRRMRWQSGVAGLGLFGVAMLTAGFTAAAGRVIFSVVIATVWLCCVVAGLAHSSDTISRERREGTLGLLFLTPLRGLDVILGKLASGAATSVQGILAIAPMTMCCLLLGGVAWTQVGLAVIVWANALFAALALGAAISTTQTDGRRAMVLSFIAMIAWTGLPYVVAYAYPRLTVPGLPGILESSFASPAYAIDKITNATAGPASLRIYRFQMLGSIVFQNVVSWGLLWIATFRVRRVALANPPNKLTRKLESISDRWEFGSDDVRKVHRERLLGVHPVTWLTLRNRHKQSYVWLLVLSSVSIATGAALYLGGTRSIPTFVLWTGYLTFLFIKIWSVGEICMRLVEDRRCGALELMLTTPTTAGDWIRGTAKAIRKLMAGPIFAVTLIAAAALAWYFHRYPSGVSSNWDWSLSASVLFVALADLPGLFWMSIWESLKAKSVNRAVGMVIFRFLMVPVYLLLGTSILLAWVLMNDPAAFSTWQPGRIATVWLSIALTFNTAVGVIAWKYARGKVLRHFRAIVSEGIDVLDPAQPRGNSGNAGWRTVGAGIATFARQHPISVGLISFAILVVMGLSIRNRIWDVRLDRAREAMWETGVSKAPPGVAKKSEIDPAVKAFMSEASAQSKRHLQFGRKVDPYDAIHRDKVRAELARYSKLISLAKALPEEGTFPSPSGKTALVLAMGQQSMQHAANAAIPISIAGAHSARSGGHEEVAKSIRALGIIYKQYTDAISRIAFTSGIRFGGADLRLLRLLHIWLNEAPIPAGQLENALGLLSRMDSWGAVTNVFLALPSHIHSVYVNPESFFGPPRGITAVMDGVSVARRRDAIEAYGIATKLVKSVGRPEAEFLQCLRELYVEKDALAFDWTQLRCWVQLQVGNVLNHADHIALIRCGRAALLVEQFRKAKARLPTDGEELTRHFGPAWPVTPWKAVPVAYMATTNGYVIEVPQSAQGTNHVSFRFEVGRGAPVPELLRFNH